MSCDTIRDLLLDHLYDALDEPEASQVTSHLESCGECRRALVQARGQRALLAEAVGQRR